MYHEEKLGLWEGRTGNLDKIIVTNLDNTILSTEVLCPRWCHVTPVDPRGSRGPVYPTLDTRPRVVGTSVTAEPGWVGWGPDVSQGQDPVTKRWESVQTTKRVWDRS